MSSSLFPSGDWYGFYNYHGQNGRHPMDIRFTFENGRVSACGGDPVGEFVLTGSYDEAAKECHWIKTYPGSHEVFYQGFREGKGIWGTWEISGCARYAGAKGGFHIWPVGLGSGDESAVQREEQVEVIAQPVKPRVATFQ